MRGYRNNSRRHGVAIFYVIVVLIVMLGFCSFAVDLGRVQTAKTELRRAADAAARGDSQPGAGNFKRRLCRHCDGRQ